MRNVSIFVLIDALGWRYLRERPFLDDVLPYRQPVRTVLGFSSGAIPSILTGVPPADHGHWNLLYYDPSGSPFQWLRAVDRAVPRPALDNRVGRRALTELGRRFLGLGRGFECAVSPHLLPYFNWVEKRNIYQPGGIAKGLSFFDQLEAAQVPYRAYSYHHFSDDEILRFAVHDIESTDAAVFFLYLSEMDSFLHHGCEDSGAIDVKLTWYEARLRAVIDAARTVDSRARISVFSDHGMTPVTRRYDLLQDIEAVGLEMPGEYLAAYDSTMARFWFFSAEARQRMSDALASNASGRILSDAELKDLGVFFPDRRFGEMVFLLHPGWMMARSNFNGSQWAPAGMHGYHPGDPGSDAIYLSDVAPKRRLESICEIYAEMSLAARLPSLTSSGPASASYGS